MTLCGRTASVPQQYVRVFMGMSVYEGRNMQPANIMLPAQTVVFAFAVYQLYSSCCGRAPHSAAAVQQTDCKSKPHGLGGKHGVDLLGRCVVDRQCLMTTRIWTGLTCTHDCTSPYAHIHQSLLFNNALPKHALLAIFFHYQNLQPLACSVAGHCYWQLPSCF